MFNLSKCFEQQGGGGAGNDVRLSRSVRLSRVRGLWLPAASECTETFEQILPRGLFPTHRSPYETIGLKGPSAAAAGEILFDRAQFTGQSGCKEIWSAKVWYLR